VSLTRRRFLGGAAATLLLPGALQALMNRAAAGQPLEARRFGPLVPDPQGLLDLPAGFQYRTLSTGTRRAMQSARWQQKLTNGDPVPGAHDGMAAFPGPDGMTLLVRNHELDSGEEPMVDPGRRRPYDPKSPGGTTTLWVRPDRTLARDLASLSGTLRNCAGGVTPWGTWISCEESVRRPPLEGRRSPDFTERVTRPHGYAFEVDPRAEDLAEPVPLVAMGRFYREAIAVDPATGTVYQSEDRGDGLIYRYRPSSVLNGSRRPDELRAGDLAQGGRLEALRIVDRPRTLTSNHEVAAPNVPIGRALRVDWVPIADPDPEVDSLAQVIGSEPAPGSLRAQGAAQGAARFSRVEGIVAYRDSIYFCSTDGGPAHRGQVWRLEPLHHRLTLVLEVRDAARLDSPDNLVPAPWGDLLACEDGDGENFLRGITLVGKLYPLARNALNDSELAGACFSPDGRTLFVNLQDPGITFAIWGPWPASAR
jgi:secreted PhoX family phosphatase